MKAGCDTRLGDAGAQVSPKLAPKRDGGDSDGLPRLPVSAEKLHGVGGGIERTRLLKSLTRRNTLQFNRCLGFVIDHATAQHYGGNGIKKASATGGKRRVQLALDHAAEQVNLRRLDAEQRDHLGRLYIKSRCMQCAQRHAARLADGGFAAGHGDVVEMCEAVKGFQAADEHFPAPDLAVGSVAGAVEREADDRALDSCSAMQAAMCA